MPEKSPNNEHANGVTQMTTLVLRYLDRDLTAEEEAELDHLLQASEENRQVFVKTCRQVTMMTEVLSPGILRTGSKKGSKGRTPVLGFLGDVFQAGTGLFSRSFVLTLLLTIGLPGLLLVALFIHVGLQPIPNSPGSVAEITQSHDAVWGKSIKALPLGTKLLPGWQLQLEKGLIELTFNNGAQVLLEGPATFDVKSKEQGFLQVGNLLAKVPKGAEGFAIGTPTAKIVDLGTEFGVSVASNGTAEAHVYKGEIEVAVSEPSDHGATLTKRFQAGEAVRITAVADNKMPQMVSKPAAIGKFVRHVPGTLGKPTILFAHYGSKNPTKEGWTVCGDGVKHLGKAGVEVGPIDKGGVSAWSIHTRKDNQVVFYSIDKGKKLTSKLISEAKQKGWVLRARIWISETNPVPPKKWLGIVGLTYRDGQQGCTIRPSVDDDGNQCLEMLIGKNEVIPIPGSRNQYVDYELRCSSSTNQVDVYINGRLAATRALDFLDEDHSTPQIRFGGWRPAINARFALVEWGILRETPIKNNLN